MDRWPCILRVPLDPKTRNYYRVAASLCLVPNSKTLAVPRANVIFFNGDRVRGTGNPVIERLSDLQKIAEVVVSKFGNSVNAWVIEASVYNRSFAVYKDFVPSVNEWGEPEFYSPVGFPATSATFSLLSNCLEEAKKGMLGNQIEPWWSSSCVSDCQQPRTILLGFSKGGTVLNQLVSELGFLEEDRMRDMVLDSCQKENLMIPETKESVLNSISEIHYVDVGLNSRGAYITDHGVIERIAKRIRQRADGLRFVFHGTPRQWGDKERGWIRKEKDKLVGFLRSEAEKAGGKLEVCERFYFAERAPPDLQMHFEIIDHMNVC